MTTYRFQVFAQNGVSLLTQKKEYVDITVTTEASVPSLVSNVRITSVKSSELSISWDAPVIEVGGDNDLVERYEGKAKVLLWKALPAMRGDINSKLSLDRAAARLIIVSISDTSEVLPALWRRH